MISNHSITMHLHPLVHTTTKEAQGSLRARAAYKASHEYLVFKNGITSTASNNAQYYLAKSLRKLYLLKVGTTSLFHHFRQNIPLSKTRLKVGDASSW